MGPAAIISASNLIVCLYGLAEKHCQSLAYPPRSPYGNGITLLNTGSLHLLTVIAEIFASGCHCRIDRANCIAQDK